MRGTVGECFSLLTYSPLLLHPLLCCCCVTYRVRARVSQTRLCCSAITGQHTTMRSLLWVRRRCGCPRCAGCVGRICVLGRFVFLCRDASPCNLHYHFGALGDELVACAVRGSDRSCIIAGSRANFACHVAVHTAERNGVPAADQRATEFHLRQLQERRVGAFLR